MMFRWHHAFWLLFALPAFVGTYLVLLRRKHKGALRYAGLGVAREAFSPMQQLRQHIPALLMFLGLTALLLAGARPAILMTSPSERGTVVLLIDVSLSMAATDVPPTRLAAARAAALDFVKAQPQGVHIGIVAFGGHADVVQPPTANRADVIAGLDRLELQRFTAIGNGLIGALLTLHPTLDIGNEFDIWGTGRVPGTGQAVPLVVSNKAGSKPNKARPPGSDLSNAIILISDGKGTIGVPPAKAAKMAADFGIRVFTIGVGTLYGGVANVEGWPPIHAEFDEAILQEIADITRGEYFLARTAEKVTKIYEKLGRRVILERQDFDVTVLFTALGVVLSLASAMLSLSWANRPA